MEATIPLAYLKAIRLFAAEKDVRYYVCGVLVTDGMIVATNGHYLAQIECKNLAGFPAMIIPNQALDFYFKKNGRGDPKYVTISLSIGKGAYQPGMLSALHREEFKPVDGVFPDFKRIMPQHTEMGPAAQFNWSYLALFEKAAILLGASKNDPQVYVMPNGQQAAAKVFIEGCPGFTGVVMPKSGSKIPDRFFGTR